jgi:hypothetical protein
MRPQRGCILQREPVALAQCPIACINTREVNMASKYGKKAGQKVKRAMHEKKRGTLKSGRSGKKVKSRKQAIAIGLSEARKAGGKVPSKKKSSSKKRKSSSRKKKKSK